MIASNEDATTNHAEHLNPHVALWMLPLSLVVKKVTLKESWGTNLNMGFRVREESTQSVKTKKPR